MDKETAKIISEAEILRDMCNSDGWQIVRQRLFSKLAELNDIFAFTEKNKDTILQEIGARQETARILIEWLKDIENSEETLEEYREAVRKIEQNEYIKQ